MKYEIIELDEKNIVGVAARTNNLIDSAEVIGRLWYSFYSDFVMNIHNRVNDKPIGLYSEYVSDEKGDYTATVGFEVTDISNVPEGTVVKKIYGGKYAKFVVEGEVFKVIPEFWQKLWAMDIKRDFKSDFEEYQSGSSAEHAVVHIFIKLSIV